VFCGIFVWLGGGDFLLVGKVLMSRGRGIFGWILMVFRCLLKGFDKCSSLTIMGNSWVLF